MSARRISALNNHGVQSLEQGHFREAAFSFLHAITCFKSVTANLAATLQEQPHYRQQESSSPPNPLEVISIPLDHVLDALNVTAVSPHNMLEVYPHAFYFSRLSTTTLGWEEQATDISIALFYNLALAHHMIALRGNQDVQEGVVNTTTSTTTTTSSSSSSEAHFNEALRFYKMAVVLFQSQDDEAQISALALPLALLNNMGHVLAHFWRIDEAQKCARVVDSLLTVAAEYLTDDEGEFFAAAIAYCTAPGACLLAPAA